MPGRQVSSLSHLLTADCGWKPMGRGNAAERLGLKRSTLQYRMKKLGITRPENRS